MTHALIIGGSRGIGKVIAQTLKEKGSIVNVMGREFTPLPTLPITHLIFCQRYRGEGSTWRGEIDTSLSLTDNYIAWADFDHDPTACIVIMSSIIAHTVASEQPVSYHMAKAALEGMVRYYAVMLGPKGIRVNGVAPGVTLKPENEEYYNHHPEKVELFSRINPLRRMGTALDVANVVSWLCSPGASFVNGQIITVDGGVSLLNQEALARSFLKEGQE